VTDEPQNTRSDRRSARLRQLVKIPKIPRISWRDLAETLGPVLLLSIGAILVALHFVHPAPPSTLTIAAGPEGSTFHNMAQRYQQVMKGKGITLNILATQGSVDNLNRLTDRGQKVDVALVQSGLTTNNDTSDLVSLGSLFYLPLTIFYRADKPIEYLSQLKGKRIAVGLEGTGTRMLALTLLKANGIEPGGDTILLSLEGEGARKALMARQADAIFLSGDSAAPATLREMLKAEGVRLYDFPQADAYTRRFRYLIKLPLPAGAFDLGENLPPQPINMLAPTVDLLARSDLHPALSDLLLEAAQEVNGRGSMLQNPGEFPAPLAHEYPISDDASRFYKSGKRLSYKFLPFWLATLVDRAVVVLVPIIVVLIPGLRLVPALYGWRINNRIYKRYGELMAVERAALGPTTPEQRTALLERLSEVEKTVISGKIPGAYANQLYVLRQHIKFVRKHLLDQHGNVDDEVASYDELGPDIAEGV
jgi:TRAP transporter TAXI family solute receptor